MQPDLSAALKSLRENRTDDALQEIREVIDSDNEDLAVAIASESTSLIRSGLIGDAVRRLECWTIPKWPDVERCERRYRAAMRACDKSLSPNSGWSR